MTVIKDLNKATVVYERPADWLPIPDVITGQEVFYGLYAVFPFTNPLVTGSGNNERFVNLVALEAKSSYTVDWGDGTTSNITATGGSYGTAEHTYDYNALPADTLTSRGYKQVIITITPQAGNNLTHINLNKKHSYLAAVTQSTSFWLDISCSLFGGASNGLNVTGSSITYTDDVQPVLLERVQAYCNGRTNFDYMVQVCRALKELDLDTDAATSMKGMCFACYGLLTADFDYTNCQDLSYIFYGCSSLTTVYIDAPAALTMRAALAQCLGLTYAEITSTSLCTTFKELFSGDLALTLISSINTSSCTDIDSMFDGCKSLLIIPDCDFSNVTTATNTFQYCRSILQNKMTGLGISFDISYEHLSGVSLDEIYTNLPTVTSKTITVTGNYGTAGDTPTIATAKGWTVTS